MPRGRRARLRPPRARERLRPCVHVVTGTRAEPRRRDEDDEKSKTLNVLAVVGEERPPAAERPPQTQASGARKVAVRLRRVRATASKARTRNEASGEPTLATHRSQQTRRLQRGRGQQTLPGQGHSGRAVEDRARRKRDRARARCVSSPLFVAARRSRRSHDPASTTDVAEDIRGE